MKIKIGWLKAIAIAGQVRLVLEMWPEVKPALWEAVKGSPVLVRFYNAVHDIYRDVTGTN